MKNINAIVLTYDRNRIFTENMIKSYEKIWVDHPLIFHIPYQNLNKIDVKSKVIFHKSKPDIHSTINTLLKNFNDNEMIYWCIDDKYPIKLDLKKIKELLKCIKINNHSYLDGLIFCRCRALNHSFNITNSNKNFFENLKILERKGYHQIWIHQFLKVKILKFLFNKFGKIKFPYKNNLETLDFKIKKLNKPKNQKLFVTKKNFAIFGESTVEGSITLNCKKSLSTNKIRIPNKFKNYINKKIYIGGFKILNNFFFENNYILRIICKFKNIFKQY